MTRSAPYLEIGAEYDQAAGDYDAQVGTNPAMCYMRRVSLAALRASFRPGQRVLEIGCGTGEEAICLGRRGVYVLATDLSPEMLSLTARKVAAAGLEDVVDTRRLAAGELDVLIDEYGRGAFDGAYSSFGPLNGEPDLRTVSRALAILIQPGGSCVVSVMNRFYPLETLWYLMHGRPRQAVRRWRGRTMASVSSTRSVVIPTWYYTPRAFERAFAPEFRRVSCRALPLLLPPPFLGHLWQHFSRFPWLFRRTSVWEERLAHLWPFNALGDHFLMILYRN